MCDIFPEFTNFLGFINLKIGMLMIAILAIVTGGLMMSVNEQRSNTSFKDMKNVANITQSGPDAMMSNFTTVTRSGITLMSVLFMFTGLVLLWGTLLDQEGFVQVAVWVTFANILFGLMLVVSVSFECITQPSCLLDGMDWLTGSTVMVLITFYLIAWLYLIAVANSFVLQVSG